MKTLLGILVMTMAVSAQARVAGDGSFEQTFDQLEARFGNAGTFHVICSCETNAMASAQKDVVGSNRQKVVERCEDFMSQRHATQYQLSNCQEL